MSDRLPVWVPCARPPAPQDHASRNRRRRDAAYRLPPLDCGCGTRDPIACRCNPLPVTERYVDGYRDAVEHLLALNLTPAPNLPAMRVMGRRDERDQRLVRHLAELWEVAA
jgi:hypothetical protein